MAASQQSSTHEETAGRRRQFVVRLEQAEPGDPPLLYDKLLAESLDRSHQEGRRVAMTEIAREAIEKHLD